MANRTLFSAVTLMVGGLCVAVTVCAASWIDTTNVHESTALNQAAVQAALQGKTIAEWQQNFHTIVSPLLLWTSFALGGCLILAGMIIGLRSFPSGPLSS
jgi:hypothetical protein